MAQIAGELYVSLNTVRTHMRSAYATIPGHTRPVLVEVSSARSGMRPDAAVSAHRVWAWAGGPGAVEWHRDTRCPWPDAAVHRRGRAWGFPVDPGWDLRRDGAWYDLVGGEADQVAPIAHRFAMLWQAASRLHVESSSTRVVRIGSRISEASCPGRCAAACSPGSAAVARRGCCVYATRLAGETIIP
jgi:hypothetical protein